MAEGHNDPQDMIPANGWYDGPPEGTELPEDWTLPPGYGPGAPQ